MAAEYMEFAMMILTVVGQYIVTKGPEKVLDKAVDAVLEKIFQAFAPKDGGENEIVRKFRKDPKDKHRQAQLAENLAGNISENPALKKELEALVEEIVRKIELSSVTRGPTPHQLLSDIGAFTGRRKELRAITKAAGQPGAGQVVVLLTGLGGTGKSALAIHAAHQLMESFPDVQLYVDLRGTEPQPVRPLDALEKFLLALGVEEADIPVELEERAKKYRSELSNRKAIVLLDNARDENQVRPLLPAGSACLVLVTSRWSLDGLQEAALTQRLTTFTEKDAFTYLMRLAGKKRVNADPESAQKIVELCGCLPLAIHIVGGYLKVSGIGLREYAARLADEHKRMDTLKKEDKDVRSGFMMSYNSLQPRAARLFRLLRWFSGETFSFEGAIVLDGGEEELAEEALAELVNLHLIDSPDENGRYGMHDLVRLLARECYEEATPREEDAPFRLARWYVERSRVMSETLQPDKRAAKLEKLTGESRRTFMESVQSDVKNALIWFERENANMLGLVEWAHASSEWELTWQLAINLEPFYNLRGLWADWERTHELALDATRRKPDEGAEGVVLNLLGNVYRLQGRWEEAESFHKQALALNRRRGNTIGESIALNLLANVYRLKGEWDEAIATFKEALEINLHTGNHFGEAITRGGLGNVYRMQGRWEIALDEYERSRKIGEDLGDQHGQSINLNNIGLVYSRTERLPEAEKLLQQSLDICEKLGNTKGNCIARRTLGEVQLLQGKPEEAFNLLTESLKIARGLIDKRCMSQALNALGEWHTDQEHWEEAGRCFEEERAILRSMNDRHDEGLALLGMGKLRFKQGRVEEARSLWKDAAVLLHPDSPEHAEALEKSEKPGGSQKRMRLFHT